MASSGLALSLQPAGAQGGGSSFPTTRQVVPSGLDAPQESSVPYIFGIVPEFRAALHFPTPGARPQQSGGERGDRASGQSDPQAVMLGLVSQACSQNGLRSPGPLVQLEPRQMLLRQQHVLGEHEEHVHGSAGDTLGGRGGPGPEGTLRCVLTTLEQRPRPEEPPFGQALGPGALLLQTDFSVCGQAGPRGQCRGWTASSPFMPGSTSEGVDQLRAAMDGGPRPEGTPVVCCYYYYYYWCHPVHFRASLHYFLIAKFRLKLKKVGKTTRPFRYDLNQIPYNYTVEVTNRVKGLDLIHRIPDELWTEVHDIV